MAERGRWQPFGWSASFVVEPERKSPSEYVRWVCPLGEDGCGRSVEMPQPAPHCRSCGSLVAAPERHLRIVQ